MATTREIESGQGLVELGEIEALARAFGITLPDPEILWTSRAPDQER